MKELSLVWQSVFPFGSIEDNVIEAALTYLTVSAISYLFLGIYNASAAMFRAMGKTGSRPCVRGDSKNAQ